MNWKEYEAINVFLNISFFKKNQCTLKNVVKLILSLITVLSVFTTSTANEGDERDKALLKVIVKEGAADLKYMRPCFQEHEDTSNVVGEISSLASEYRLGLLIGKLPDKTGKVISENKLSDKHYSVKLLNEPDSQKEGTVSFTAPLILFRRIESTRQRDDKIEKTVNHWRPVRLHKEEGGKQLTTYRDHLCGNSLNIFGYQNDPRQARYPRAKMVISKEKLGASDDGGGMVTAFENKLLDSITTYNEQARLKHEDTSSTSTEENKFVNPNDFLYQYPSKVSGLKPSDTIFWVHENALKRDDLKSCLSGLSIGYVDGQVIKAPYGAYVNCLFSKNPKKITRELSSTQSNSAKEMNLRITLYSKWDPDQSGASPTEVSQAKVSQAEVSQAEVSQAEVSQAKKKTIKITVPNVLNSNIRPIIKGIKDNNIKYTCEFKKPIISCGANDSAEPIKVEFPGFKPYEIENDKDLTLTFKAGHEVSLSPTNRQVDIGGKNVGENAFLCAKREAPLTFAMGADEAVVDCHSSTLSVAPYGQKIVDNIIKALNVNNNGAAYCHKQNNQAEIICEKEASNTQVKLNLKGYKGAVFSADSDLLSLLKPITPIKEIKEYFAGVVGGEMTFEQVTFPPLGAFDAVNVVNNTDFSLRDIIKSVEAPIYFKHEESVPDKVFLKIKFKINNFEKNATLDSIQLGLAKLNDTHKNELNKLLDVTGKLMFVGNNVQQQKTAVSELSRTQFGLAEYTNQTCNERVAKPYKVLDSLQEGETISSNIKVPRYFQIEALDNEPRSNCAKLMFDKGNWSLQVLPFLKVYESWNILLLAIPESWDWTHLSTMISAIFDDETVEKLDMPLILVTIDNLGRSARIYSSNESDTSPLKNLPVMAGYRAGRSAQDIYHARRVSGVSDEQTNKLIIVAGAQQSAAPSNLTRIRDKVWLVSDDCEPWAREAAIENCKAVRAPNELINVIKNIFKE